MWSMMEVSSVGVEEGDEEIELSLGLSIGGNFGKSTRLNPEEQKNTNADTDLSQEIQNQNSSGFSMAQTFVGDSEQESGAEHLDPKRKREIHALRRQEARKKREEKLRKRSVTVGSDFSDENMWLEAQRLQIRVKDRERRENEGKIEGGERKREKNEERGHLNLALNHNGAQNPSHGSSATACGSSPLPIPVVPYPPLQLVPFANGFAYPCIMPCLAPAACNVGNEKNEKNVQRPLACRSFRPCQGSLNPLMGSDSEYVSGKEGDAVSNGSPIYSSSLVSENRSSSQQGGSSSDTGSRSSHSKPNQSHLKFASEHSVSSTQMESTQAGDKLANNTDNAVLPSIIQSNPTKLGNQTDSETHPDPDKNPITSQIPNPGPLKANEGLNTPSLSQMPCVSTTGNGPNGKTITGFLYRYTKAEVSIVCVCHGNSFSPAEFVEHAGGKDITHPLRHITVIPSAFG